MLKGQAAIITGASRGIGKEVARQFAEQGVKLALLGSSEDIHATGNALKQAGYSHVLSFSGDVSNENDVEQVVQAAKNAYGSVDILINNAGVGKFKAVEDVTVEEWRKTHDINVQGVFLTTKAVLPLMKHQQFGTILTVASDVSRYTIPEGGALYTSTKYAVQGFMGSVAQEVRSYGIRAGTVNPGKVDTFFGDSQQGDPAKADWLKVEDIAEAIVYMAGAPKHMVVDELQLHPLSQDYPRP
ncbi:SDR family oxidoreductase [Thalassobacillus sp. CUG 92003]|uniref:SDR family oxidoreductase n=1 Tax=Thalassobacillus sp. CUG 92003 TaxID=2736641 RepID=UPI0015E6B825|nr:SDR family oxidoreductase [Thalassobacillus sp. CUG 92003]